MMNSNRPKIEVPIEGIDIIIDMVSAVLLLGMIIYTGMHYAELPDIIPSHFNAKGDVDGYSEKYTLWFLPVLCLVLFVALFILNKYPHIHNYMVNITEENALKNYRFSTRIVRFTNLFVMITFAMVVYSIIQAAQGNALKLGDWVLPFVIGFSVILPAAILIYQRKMNRS